MAALTVCLEPGCVELVERGRCVEHRRPSRRDGRGDPHNQRRWKERSTAFRRRNATCVVCGAPATQVDHVINRDLLVAAGIHDPDHDRWLQALCLPCHGSKTRVVDDRYAARLADGEDPERLCEWALQAATEWADRRRVEHAPRPLGGGA